MAPEEEASAVLKFQRWSSRVDEEFWQSFSSRKLDTIHLDEKPLAIQGYHAPCAYAQISNHLQLRAESFPAQLDGGSSSFLSGDRNKCPAPGTLYNVNTKEEFLAIDKHALLEKEAKELWDDICSGRAVQDCRLLNRFFLISYADLKKWRFHYWVAFPALVLDPPAKYSLLQPASEIFGAEKAGAVLAACQSWRASPLSTTVPFFLLHMTDTSARTRPLTEWFDCQEGGGKVILAFYDPCHLRTNPGWPLRNFLTLAAVQWGQRHVQVLCYREKRGQADMDQCLIANVALPENIGISSRVPDAVGWEYNPQQKGMRVADLASSMDPVRLAESAANLNLKLMRWRLLPSLDMDLLSKTKCLILGAGTLGCEVARGLMAWGIRCITLVDGGRVLLSSPFPESLSLYTSEDYLNGGKMKAEAAAEKLGRIFPCVVAKGVELSIPVGGHHTTESEELEVEKACKLLHDLVDEHDVIFLLTDTQESRWLPTLLCANANKIAISVALGSDAYLVMRHGATPSRFDASPNHGATMVENARLGCYFCKDVAPLKDTMCFDAAPIAAAYAVELTINLLHHPSKIDAPADEGTSPTIVEPLGILPHEIWGSVANFSQQVSLTNASNKCTACSADAVSKYNGKGFDFLRQVFDSPNYLQELTGLTNQLAATNLNLNAMSCQIMPSLNVDLLSKTKCLLLGAGTLGCQVARGLMAKGIRHITLVDNGRVAMSNPVRQSLFMFEDCLNGGKPKAAAAAETLRCISSTVEAKGVQLTVPMPGHRITESEAPEVERACKILHELVDEHDIVFLLTDTRESRWLPTLLCSNANKIAINAALGFDTFLVMRHGATPSMLDIASNIEGAVSATARLGCYFCNDVVAPEDSTINRTLDQQCTVTRPGLARIAAALAVKFAINLLHHPANIDARVTSPQLDDKPLTFLPHQIRGCVSNFSQQAFVGNAFNKCTACSAHVIAEYRQQGFNFLRQVFNSPTYLEDLTGLTKLLAETSKVDIDWEED